MPAKQKICKLVITTNRAYAERMTWRSIIGTVHVSHKAQLGPIWSLSKGGFLSHLWTFAYTPLRNSNSHYPHNPHARR